MECYLKSFTTFRTISRHTATDYNLAVDSIDGTGSAVTVPGDLAISTAGSWLLLNGLVYLVSAVAPQRGQTRLTLQPPDEVFNRQILFVSGNDTTIGGFIQRIVETGWVNQPDAVYALPYLDVENADETPFVTPEIDENRLFNLLAYIRSVRASYNIALRFSVDRDRLKLRIEREPVTTHPLVIGDGHTQLASSTFSTSTVAKVTVLQPVVIPPEQEDDEATYEITSTDWYLSQDGVASTAPPSNRQDGEWITIVASETDDQMELVMEEFSQNGDSHKVELYSDRDMAVGDKFRVKIGAELYEGTIIRKGRKKGDSRVLYTSGEMITTIQERVYRTQQAAQGGYTGDGSGQMYAVGDIYLTTRVGNPADLLGYGAWQQLSGRFLYAADGEYPVNTKAGSASVTLTEENLPGIEIVDPDHLGVALEGSTTGSSHYYLYSDSYSVRKKTLGTAAEIPIMPPLFAVFAWIRKE